MAVHGDNQQATPSESEIAWLAGLIEGDGTLALTVHERRQHEGSNPKISVLIRVYNTDAAIITKCVDILLRMGVGHYVEERDMKPMLKPDGEGTYHSPDPMLAVNVKKFADALVFLSRIRPWLFGDKAPRADLILKFLARRLARIEKEGNGNTRLPYHRDDLCTAREFYALTRKGKSPTLERVLND